MLCNRESHERNECGVPEFCAGIAVPDRTFLHLTEHPLRCSARRPTLTDMVCGVRWQWVLAAFAFTAVWFTCAIPLLTGGLLADIYRAPLSEIRTLAFATRFIGTFVLALSPPMVAVGEVVRGWSLPVSERTPGTAVVLTSQAYDS